MYGIVKANTSDTAKMTIDVPISTSCVRACFTSADTPNRNSAIDISTV